MSKLKDSSLPGFTLLELLISVTIMLLMVGGGIASYITFSQTRQVVTAGQELRDFIRLAQQKAAVGEVPPVTAVCDQSNPAKRLVGYRATKANGSRTVQVFALCGASSPGSLNSTPSYTYTIPSAVTISPTTAWNYSFYSLQETPIISPTSITLSGAGKTFTISITSAGSISGS